MRLFKRNAKETHLYSRWAYKRGDSYPCGLISRIIFSLENGWADIRGGLKPGGGVKMGFYGMQFLTDKYCNNYPTFYCGFFFAEWAGC